MADCLVGCILAQLLTPTIWGAGAQVAALLLVSLATQNLVVLPVVAQRIPEGAVCTAGLAAAAAADKLALELLGEAQDTRVVVGRQGVRNLQRGLLELLA
jgi:hypothetical protein